MDYCVHKYLLAELTDDKHLNHKHNLLPSVNQCPKDFVYNAKFPKNVPYRKPFEYNFQHYEVYSTGQCCTDVSLDFIKKKERWLIKLNRFKPADAKKARRELRAVRDGKSAELSLALRLYLKQMDCEPEPDFKGDFNWLFSGNTVQSLVIKDKKILVYPSGYFLSTLCLSELNEDLKKEDLDIIEWKLKINQPILQIAAERNFICTRQKNNVTLFSCDSINLKILWKKKVRRPNFFTSICIKDGQIAMTTSRRELYIFDIVNTNRRKLQIMQSRSKLLKWDRWLQIFYVSYHFWVADRKFLYKIDLSVINQNVAFSMLSVLENCDSIYQIVLSNLSEDYCYILSRHNIFLFDAKNLKFLSKWTHLTSQPPIYCSTYFHDSQELLVFSSFQIDEILGITISFDSNLINSLMPPKKLICVADSLREARLNGLILSPIVSKRVRFSVIGIHLVDVDGRLVLFVQNSGGDIFLSCVTKRNFLESLTEYERNCSQYFRRKPFQVTDIVDMFDVIKDLPKVSKKRRPAGVCNWRQEAQFHPDSLSLYKDYLVKNILKVWNIKQREILESSSNEEEEGGDNWDSVMKVKEWFSKHDV